MMNKEALAKKPVSVDVVVPVLNEAHVLEKSINTLRDYLGSDFPHRWRIVIVDNDANGGPNGSLFDASGTVIQ